MKRLSNILIYIFLPMDYKNKIISGVLLVLFSTSAASAWDYYSSWEYKYNDGKLANWYYEAIIDKDILEFEAERDWHLIKMEWSSFDKWDFAYYKIMRSETNENPIYPDQPAIRVLSNVEQDWLKLENYSQKDAYYRICAITKEKKRYCSNVVKLEWFEKDDYKSDDYNYTDKEYTEEEKYEYEAKKAEHQKEIADKKAEYEKKFLEKKEVAKTKAEEYRKKMEEKDNGLKEKREAFIKDKKASIKEKVAKKADMIVDKFSERINSQFDSTEKKQDAIKKVMEKLEALWNKNEKLRALTSYINDKLEEKLAKYEDDWFDEIENIFSEFE